MPNEFHWGPTNPHPLSQMRTELVWEGKYDEFGRRREVDVAGLSMPMQRIETVDEPRQRAEAAGQLELFENAIAGHKQDDFRNRLLWGDNKLVMASLLAEFKGRIDLIYIDPPFDVGADFTMDIPLGEDNETIEKDQSALEMVAYKDMWGRGKDSYLQMMFERIILMKELLSERGSIYIHCDWRVSASLRFALDEIFDSENFVNEVIWLYKTGGLPEKLGYGKKHDTLHFFAKRRESCIWNPQKEKSYLMHKYGFSNIEIFEDEQGQFTMVNCRDVFDIAALRGNSPERVDYPTQKPEALIERIVRASSEEGGIVADFFCGSGTTGAVAERLGRRWIMTDLGRFAIHTSRKRLIELQRKLHAEGQPYRAFDVYNLGRYERQWWQRDRLKGAEEEHRRVVLEFFKAQPFDHFAPPPQIHMVTPLTLAA